jgi:hypothetical protein
MLWQSVAAPLLKSVPLGGFRQGVDMASGLRNKLAGQIAEHLVCAELGRLDLIATPFSGNVPLIDVVVADADGRTVAIQVKASRSDNWPTDARDWMQLDLDSKSGVQNYGGPVKLRTPDLIWVCVALAPDEGSRDRFFVLTKADVQKACISSYRRWMEPRAWKRPRSPASYDCRFAISDIVDYEGNWKLVLRALGASVTTGQTEAT